MADEQDKLIITRKQALERGLKRYFTGKPCGNGHLSEKLTSNQNCIECHKSFAKLYHKKRLERQRKYRLNDPDRYKKYNIKHKKSTYIASKRWRKNNPEKIKVYKNNDYKKHKENYRKHQRAYTARKKNAIGSHTTFEILELMNKQGNRCVECKRKISMEPKEGEMKAHLDHINPLKLGGSNNIENLQFLCRSCNISKGAIEPMEWARKKGRLL